MSAPAYREQHRFAEPKERVRKADHSMSPIRDWPFQRHELDTSIDLLDGTVLVFQEEVGCVYEKSASRFRFLICPLDIEAEADTIPNARQAAGKKAWDETKRLLHTPSHTLEIAEMERKGLLLGYVDVVKSRIATQPRNYVWVMGQIERDDAGVARFRASSRARQRFEFAPNWAHVIPTDDEVRMAKVRADDRGLPVGPVIELEQDAEDNPAEL